MSNSEFAKLCYRLIRSLRLNEQLAEWHFFTPKHCPHFDWGFWTFPELQETINCGRKLIRRKIIETLNEPFEPFSFRIAFYTSTPTSVPKITEQLKFSLIAQLFVSLTKKYEEHSYQLVEFILEDNKKGHKLQSVVHEWIILMSVMVFRWWRKFNWEKF